MGERECTTVSLLLPWVGKGVINTVIPAPVGGRRVINTVIPAPVGVRKVCTMVSLLLPWVGEEERLKTGNPLQRGVVHKEHTFRTHPFHCW